MVAKKNVPELRFPEFSGEWTASRLKKCSKIIDGDRGVNYPKKNQLLDSGHCLFLNANNVTNQGFKFINTTFIAEDVDNKLNNGKLNRNDLVITTRGSVGNIAFYNSNIKYNHVRINSGMVIIRPTTEVSSNYLYQYFFAFHFQSQIKKFAFGSAQPQLTVSIIKNLKLYYPLINEQTKIANFLTAVDNKIEQLEQKKALAEQYKKGMMQQLFSQQIRFKDDDGREFPEWEEKSLGQISNITTGKLDANAMVENGIYRFYTCAKDYYRINNYMFDTDALIISGNGANVGYIHHYKGKFNAYQRTYVIDKVDANIVYTKYFLALNLHKNIAREKKEGNTPYIVIGTLLNMMIELPSLKEQTKIANFLTSLDQKIELLEQQINQAKDFKKGLLQKMLI